MSNKYYPYLCGGILLNLLIEAKKTSIPAREKLNSKKSSVSEFDILKGLIEIVTGTEIIATESTLKKDTSRYKRCEINCSSIIPFNEPSIINIFKDKYINNWRGLADEIKEFIDSYLLESKLEWFTKAILEIILSDSSITDDTIFVISQNNKINKKDLKNVENVEIEIFLICILIYIIVNKKDNTLGRYTFNKFYEQKYKRSTWKLKYEFGSIFTQPIKINRFNTIKTNNNKINNQRIIKGGNYYKPKLIKSHKPLKLCEPKEYYENVDYSYFCETKFYNLIVGGINTAIYKNNSKTCGYFIMPKNRIINSWCDSLVKPLSKLGTKEKNILISLPTIFAVDQGPLGHKDGDLAHYGFVRKINVLGDNVKIVFEIISSFSQLELYKNNFEFNIKNFELYNTHWAVKEVDLEEELSLSDIEFF